VELVPVPVVEEVLDWLDAELVLDDTEVVLD
jgi:hypothetical protein